jgi:hypothetical protein
MSKSTFTTFLIRTVVVVGFVVSGWLAWFAALWFVDHAKMHGTSFQFVESVALIITVIGVIPMLAVGAVSGIVAALWITRRKVSDDEYHINAA